MNAQQEAFEFDLNTLFRLEKTRRPIVSISVYAELLASRAIQNSSIVDADGRFLTKTLKIGSKTLAETLNDLRRMGLVSFIPIKARGNKKFIKLIRGGR